MKVQSIFSNTASSLTSIPSHLVSAMNQTIHLIGLAALKISAALMAVFERCKRPFSKAGPSVPHTFKFKQENSLEARKEVSSGISKMYPDTVAVIVERHFASKAHTIDQTKYVVPQQIVVTKFKDELKKHFPPSQQNLAFFIDNGENAVLPLTDGEMKTIAENYRNADGFLYIYYTRPGERV